VSFGRRLALCFVLIAIVPATALIAILLLVSDDSERGKSDARIAAGLQTALAVYGGRVDAARSDAQRFAGDPALATALRGDRAQLEAWTRRAARQPGVARVELFDRAGTQTAAAGPVDSVAFARVGLTENLRVVGALRLSTITGEQYVTAVKRLTQRELVLREGDRVLAATVTPPERTPESDETADLTAGGAEYRGHELALNGADGETLLLLGPRDGSDVFGIGGPALGILVWFLVTAVALAWALARTLTRLHQRVETQASTDPLTGLWNRRYMTDTLEREVARAFRFGHPVSLIILDVDDFKRINDRQGHLQGDLVLERVADVLREATRTIDVAARYGGDELALILVETDREGATILGERLAERVRETEVPLRDGGSMAVTISVGVATLPDSADDLESLVDAADRALLSAKRAGKNQLRTASVTKARSADAAARHRRQPPHRTTRRR
jgi:diguanylate cyclase (GGDEF)-like protein